MEGTKKVEAPPSFKFITVKKGANMKKIKGDPAKDEVTAKVTTLEIDGINYNITSTKRSKNRPSPEQELSNKLKGNTEKQEEEVNALSLIYKERFKTEDEINKKYSIEFLIRGAPDANLQFSFPPQYPSDVPPTYTLNAPWVREKQRMELYKALTNIYSENFGRCILYFWADKIEEILKKINEDFRMNPQEDEEEVPVAPEPVPQEKENWPEVFEGNPIWDRGSCFSPYLAKVTSESEVKEVIEKIEDCRKVSTAWRNTYAYRYTTSGGKSIEVGEDGGEPKAGRNLLQRLINYNANDVIVYISRRVGGSLLGPDRFKHLNDAADSVLIACGYKHLQHGQKENHGSKKKDKKLSKMKK